MLYQFLHDLLNGPFEVFRTNTLPGKYISRRGKKKKKCSTVRLFTDLSVPSYVLRYAIQQKSINKNSCQQMAQSMLPLVTWIYMLGRGPNYLHSVPVSDMAAEKGIFKCLKKYKLALKYKISTLWGKNTTWIVPSIWMGLVSLPGAHGYKQ